MLMQILRKLGRWLRDFQDPRYRKAPFVLPSAWHGHGSLSDEDIARLTLNVRDIGLDPATVSRQPHNQMLLAIQKGFRSRS
jgi:hypothetical protein